MKNKELNISTYEEWFIDHLDGNLSKEEDDQLESFLLLHPELADELDGMEALYLEASDLSFPDKESLLIPSKTELHLMKIAEKGSLADLQYLDEDQIGEVNSWKNTILSADQTIRYPDISELLQEEAAPIVPLWVLQFAVAASMIGVISWVFFSSSEKIYQPRNGMVEILGEDVDDLLTADYSEYLNSESEEVIEDIQVIPVKENAPLIAEQEKDRSTDPIQYDPIDLPEEQLVEENEPLPSSTSEEAIDEPTLLFTDESPQEDDIPQPNELDSEESLATTSNMHSDTIKGQVKENDPPLELQKSSVKETFPQNDAIANIDESEPILSKSSAKEYSSVIGFLKDKVVKTAEDKELLAMDDVSEEDQYIRTSFRIGGVEFSRLKKRK